VCLALPATERVYVNHISVPFRRPHQRLNLATDLYDCCCEHAGVEGVWREVSVNTRALPPVAPLPPCARARDLVAHVRSLALLSHRRRQRSPLRSTPRVSTSPQPTDAHTRVQVPADFAAALASLDIAVEVAAACVGAEVLLHMPGFKPPAANLPMVPVASLRDGSARLATCLNTVNGWNEEGAKLAALAGRVLLLDAKLASHVGAFAANHGQERYQDELTELSSAAGTLTMELGTMLDNLARLTPCPAPLLALAGEIRAFVQNKLMPKLERTCRRELKSLAAAGAGGKPPSAGGSDDGMLPSHRFPTAGRGSTSGSGDGNAADPAGAGAGTAGTPAQRPSPRHRSGAADVVAQARDLLSRYATAAAWLQDALSKINTCIAARPSLDALPIRVAAESLLAGMNAALVARLQADGPLDPAVGAMVATQSTAFRTLVHYNELGPACAFKAAGVDVRLVLPAWALPSTAALLQTDLFIEGCRPVAAAAAAASPDSSHTAAVVAEPPPEKRRLRQMSSHSGHQTWMVTDEMGVPIHHDSATFHAHVQGWPVTDLHVLHPGAVVVGMDHDGCWRVTLFLSPMRAYEGVLVGLVDPESVGTLPARSPEESPAAIPQPSLPGSRNRHDPRLMVPPLVGQRAAADRVGREVGSAAPGAVLTGAGHRVHTSPPPVAPLPPLPPLPPLLLALLPSSPRRRLLRART